jgi:hypothetical protein
MRESKIVISTGKQKFTLRQLQNIDSHPSLEQENHANIYLGSRRSRPQRVELGVPQHAAHAARVGALRSDRGHRKVQCGATVHVGEQQRGRHANVRATRGKERGR